MISATSKTLNEYTFSINTIFRIEHVENSPSKDVVLHDKLQPISTRDKLIWQLMQPIRKETEGSPGVFELAKLMILMNQDLTAETIYNSRLSETEIDDFITIEFIHCQLASIQEKVNNTSVALTFYERTLKISASYRLRNDSFVLTILMKIADMLEKQKRYDTALEKYHEALGVELQASEPTY